MGGVFVLLLLVISGLPEFRVGNAFIRFSGRLLEALGGIVTLFLLRNSRDVFTLFVDDAALDLLIGLDINSRFSFLLRNCILPQCSGIQKEDCV